jgi:hypothetical protein
MVTSRTSPKTLLALFREENTGELVLALDGDH